MTLLGLNYTLAQFARKLHVFVFFIFEKVSNIKLIFESLITAWGEGMKMHVVYFRGLTLTWAGERNDHLELIFVTDISVAQAND